MHTILNKRYRNYNKI